MNRIRSSEKILIFSRYIGQQVVINSANIDNEDTIGTLTGIKDNALLINIGNVNRWIPLSDALDLCEIKLLLKPLKKLTPAIIKTANSLPVQAFITPYYQTLGFDMPVYIAPGHTNNSKYLVELNLADYRTAEEILSKNNQLVTVQAYR